jgi:hypothetical protein
MTAEGFVSLRHPSVGSNLIFLATGLPPSSPRRWPGRRGRACSSSSSSTTSTSSSSG